MQTSLDENVLLISGFRVINREEAEAMVITLYTRSEKESVLRIINDFVMMF